MYFREFPKALGYNCWGQSKETIDPGKRETQTPSPHTHTHDRNTQSKNRNMHTNRKTDKETENLQCDPLAPLIVLVSSGLHKGHLWSNLSKSNLISHPPIICIPLSMG